MEFPNENVNDTMPQRIDNDCAMANELLLQNKLHSPFPSCHGKQPILQNESQAL